jgi:hypothetical protein
MAIDQVFTNVLTFRWDESSQQLLVTDASSLNVSEPIAKVSFATLDGMTWPEASKFIGEFVTLLVPTLRARFAPEFADIRPPPNETNA